MKKTTFSGTAYHLENNLSFSKKVREATQIKEHY